MPSVQEIIRSIKRVRADLYRTEGVTPQQHCDHIEDVIRTFHPSGQVWLSRDHRMADDYMIHCVGVFPVRKKSGIIAQFSGARQEDTAIVIGTVSDVTNRRKVRKALEFFTRKKGWIRLPW